jgi:hypothetical protein
MFKSTQFALYLHIFIFATKQELWTTQANEMDYGL